MTDGTKKRTSLSSQAYVIAAAQAGTHNEKRESFGHSVEFIASQVGRPIVDKLLDAVKDTAKKSYAN